MTAEEKAAQELATEIATVRRTIQEQGGQIADLQTAKAAVEAKLQAVHQAQDAAQRSHVERSASGSNRDLDVYVTRAAPPAQERSHYRQVDGNSIRLTGYAVKSRDAEGVEHQTWLPGLLDDPAPKTAAQLALQRAVTRRSIARQSLKHSKRHTPQLDADVLNAARALGDLIPVEKILADSPGIGASWVPDTTVPELEREIMMPTGLVSLFPRRVLNGPTLIIPRIAGRTRVHIHRVPTRDDPAADPLSRLTDASRTIETVSAATGIQWDRDWEADTILEVLPEIQRALAAGWHWAEDDTLMNGDISPTHQDAIQIWDPRGMLGGIAGLGTSIDHRRRWNGLRRRAKAAEAVTTYGATDQSGQKTWAGFKAALGNVGVPNLMAANGTSNVVAITSWEYFFNTMLDFEQFASWEKIGALASILTGQIGNVGGTPGGILPGQVGYVQGMVPVIVASAMTADLASTGLFTGAGNTTGMVICDRTRFEYVIRKNLVFEQETDIRNNTVTVVARGRTNFQPVDATPIAADGVRDVHYSFGL